MRNVTKVTADLLPQTWDALERAIEQTGDDMTAVINRAVQLYAKATEPIGDGRALRIDMGDCDPALTIVVAPGSEIGRWMR